MKPPSPQTDSVPGLRANALSFSSVLTQGITHIAPAMGLVVTVQFVTTMAGIASPLAYGIAFLIVLMLGVCLAQLALHLPSAGGYYTYVSRSLNPKAGFLAAWMFFLYDPLTAAVNLAYMGFLLQTTLRIEAHVNCPWYVFYVILALLITLLIYRGIEISAAFVTWLTVIEVLIIIVLAIASLMHPGDGRLHLQDFVSVHDFRKKGLYLAIVFSIFTFTGFEAVAPLAEETRNPRRAIPRAILLSITLMGAFFVFTTVAILTGWGNSHIDTFAQSAENPVILLAKRLWGAAWIFVLVAVLNSILGAAISGTNAAIRVFYAMGRARSLPAALEYIHPRFRTPVNAILLQTFITLTIGIAIGFWIGPDQEYYFLGVTMTLTLIFIYSAGNVGVFFLYRRERRAEFSPVLHFLFPVLSTLSLLWVAYHSVVPLPDRPLRYAPILVGTWLLAGLLVLLTVRRASNMPLLPLDSANLNSASVPETAALAGHPRQGI
jgi:amino acid transporter